MSRRHSAEKREIIPDAKYGDVVLTKFMNSVMYEGKKSVAEGIVYGALDTIEGKVKGDPLKVFEQALERGVVVGLDLDLGQAGLERHYFGHQFGRARLVPLLAAALVYLPCLPETYFRTFKSAGNNWRACFKNFIPSTF